jgi:cyclin-dependent kinase 5 activator 1
MGTVLSFSPRERRPIYTTTHHHHHQHHGSSTINSSKSTSSDFQLSTSYAYEQINNAKNRGENTIKQPMQYLTVPNQFHHHHNENGVLFNANSTTTNILNNNLSCSNSSLDERHIDGARILSEKNAIEKNLKKHSLFINALSWKRLSSSHGKKKHLETNNNVKNKSVTTSATFRQDVVHPMVVVNEKKKFQHQQQVQLITTTKNTISQIGGSGQTLFYDPGDPKSLVALDLERAANNANNLHHHHHHHQIDKFATKNFHSLRPFQLIENHGQQAAPRKTIIQVSLKFLLINK